MEVPATTKSKSLQSSLSLLCLPEEIILKILTSVGGGQGRRSEDKLGPLGSFRAVSRDARRAADIAIERVSYMVNDITQPSKTHAAYTKQLVPTLQSDSARWPNVSTLSLHIPSAPAAASHTADMAQDDWLATLLNSAWAPRLEALQLTTDSEAPPGAETSQPSISISSLTGFPSLTRLSLSHLSFSSSSLTPLAQLPSLQVLDLWLPTADPSIPIELPPLPPLRSLFFMGPRVRKSDDFIELALPQPDTWTTLSSLQVWYCSFQLPPTPPAPALPLEGHIDDESDDAEPAAPDALVSLPPNLTTLRLCIVDCMGSLDLSPLSHLTSLELIAPNPATEDIPLPDISSLQTLRTLVVGNTDHVAIPGLEALTALEKLFLSNVSFCPCLPPPLLHLASLRVLSVEGMFPSTVPIPPTLEALSMYNFPPLPPLTALARTVRLSHCHSLRKLHLESPVLIHETETWVSTLPHLQEVVFGSLPRMVRQFRSNSTPGDSGSSSSSRPGGSARVIRVWGKASERFCNYNCKVLEKRAEPVAVALRHAGMLHEPRVEGEPGWLAPEASRDVWLAPEVTQEPEAWWQPDF